MGRIPELKGPVALPLDFEDEEIAAWLRHVRDIEDWNEDKQEAKAPAALLDISK